MRRTKRQEKDGVELSAVHANPLPVGMKRARMPTTTKRRQRMLFQHGLPRPKKHAWLMKPWRRRRLPHKQHKSAHARLLQAEISWLKQHAEKQSSGVLRRQKLQPMPRLSCVRGMRLP